MKILDDRRTGQFRSEHANPANRPWGVRRILPHVRFIRRSSRPHRAETVREPHAGRQVCLATRILVATRAIRRPAPYVRLCIKISEGMLGDEARENA